MGFQSENRLDVLGLGWFLASVLLVLSCYYCPLQIKPHSCSSVTSQCSPDQYCASSRGYYGAVHVLSAQGCVDAALCDSREVTTYRGVKYNVTHTCYTNACNERPKSLLNALLGKSAHKTDVDISKALTEALQDSFTSTSAPNATGQTPQTL